MNKWGIYLIPAVILVIGIVYIGFLFTPIKLSGQQEYIYLFIENGMTPRQIANALQQNNIIRNPSHFLIATRLTGLSTSLKAGHYSFSNEKNTWQLLQKLSRGEVTYTRVTIPEGMRATQIASILREELHIDSTMFVSYVFNPELARELEIDARSLEGYLFPDTYYFNQNASELQMIEQMVQQFKTVYTQDFHKQANALDMTMHEIVTLASIIEGEAVIDEERPIISALYHKRLDRGMRLQADPTIQYIIKNGPRRLLNTDLEIDSPYNTYIYAGLPPGPVNNPGEACIRAALYPADVNYLYMVANGDGSHTFSTNMDSHLKAKARFDRLRRRYNGRR